MKKDLLHLFPALIALLIFVGFLLAGSQYAQFMENKYVHGLAPMLLPQSLVGSALQQAALRQPDLLPVYGSSELIRENTPFRAFSFFNTYPSGFTVFEVARSAATSLSMAEELAALGPELRGKKVVISFTPAMFNAGEVSLPAYEENYSQLHGDALIFNPYLSFAVKQQVAQRMLDYPKTLSNDPILQFAVMNLSSTSVLQQTLYYLAFPLGQLETLIIRLQDHWQVLNIIWSKPNLRAKVIKRPVTIQWNSLIAEARAEQALKTNNNPYGFENSSWIVVRKTSKEENIAPPGSKDAQFIKNLDKSKEWTDLEILLEILRETGAQPLILSRPIDGTIWNARGVSQNAREIYYDRLQNIVVDTYGMPLVDFKNHDGDRYFSNDSLSHTSRLGWVYVDQTLDAFFHGNLQ
ncbi:MAG: D-alanyl-lipoteichoic acid biosynthesis protein DltD [Anaerolineaceae bacterium]|nr:D-alanyl-lipoteichoic acid biosynthesis protein DltD [Anaerolineaceae bacterium]